MMQRMRIGTAIVIIMLMFSGCSNAEEKKSSETGLSQGKTAPDFVLNDLEGKQVSLSSFKNTNAVCLVFWATWCPYCVTEVPKVKKLHEKYSAKGLKILSINIAANDPMPKVVGFQKKLEIPYTILYDEKNIVSQLYGVMGIPVSVIIDRKGVIKYRGYQLPDNVEEIFSQIL
jgi:peroxiredoxin